MSTYSSLLIHRNPLIMTSTQVSWQEIAAAKRASVKALIPPEWLIPVSKLEEFKKSENGVLHVPRESGILSTEEIKITEGYDAVELAEELRMGRLSAVDVTRAFSKRAAVAQQLVRGSVFCLGLAAGVRKVDRDNADGDFIGQLPD
jgi:hypothetical protein